MRDYEKETNDRVQFIRQAISEARADGIIFGNSGGKDSALVGILCKKACENTLGVIMPCGSRRNLEEDREDALTFARMFSIETKIVDLNPLKKQLLDILQAGFPVQDDAKTSIAITPRLRMITLYTAGASRNALVAGTGNRSEIYMGYFTKWGDGACDFNPIGDLTVTEVYEFLEYLGAPECIIQKAPSAGLFDGQTDEGEMGISYREIDDFLLHGIASEKGIMEKYHNASGHKRRMPLVYGA